MPDIDKRLAEIAQFVGRCKEKQARGDLISHIELHAILCQLNMIRKDLQEYHLIKKCRCCCEEV